MRWRLDNRDPGFAADFTALVEARREATQDVRAAVEEIVAAIRHDGDAALLDMTRRFDRWQPADAAALRIDAAEMRSAWEGLGPDLQAALQLAAARIRAFHLEQRPRDLDVTDAAGVRMGQRWTAVSAVGLYVPGGTAAYPSSVLMNAIPAAVAGASRIVMAVPTPDGLRNPAVLAAAHLAGVAEVLCIGGAQAVAALAYGTQSLAPVDKIVGPGNTYVAEAKRQVFGRVGIDMVAGPSEILVLADETARPDWVAMDLLSQAEHDSAAQSILITDSLELADAVESEVARLVETLPRADIARASWQQHGAILTVAALDEAVPLVDRLAPEHLELAVQDPEPLRRAIRHAGSIFLGHHTPEAIGDYVGGPNHVLPTGRSARFASGLGVLDFMKRTTFLQVPEGALPEIGHAAMVLARAEGLEAHALSVEMRLS